jgi:serine/threonine-protein kinase
MSLTPGTRLGSYEILSLLGAGGMGEVYRAQDSKLKRLVAVKILQDSTDSSRERLFRFEREAELLASLNHTNIAIVHDFEEFDGRRILVMELVEGETLAQCLERGPLPIGEALAVARQLAEALEAAHQKGIIHRDLKPANIKILPGGKVKILDFGLAKIYKKETPSISDSKSTMLRSNDGVIVGTPAYMSPEQSRGNSVDKRTDIWAFGCVVYEMLSGKRAFAGGNVSDTIASVLREDPDWNALPSATPRRIRLLLQRCLRKEPSQRLHDAGDARIEIDDTDAAAATNEAASPPVTRRAVSAILIGFLVAAIFGAGVWWVLKRSSAGKGTPLHLSIELPYPTLTILNINASHRMTISPDGRKIAYVVQRGEKLQLFIRSLEQPEGKLIDGPDDVRVPFFSPDSEWIAYGQGQELQKVAVSGGAPVTICKLASTAFYGGDWGDDNRIAFVPDFNGGLWSVSANGGMAQPMLKTDLAKDRVAYGDPQVLPGGRGVMFTLTSSHAVAQTDLDIAVMAPDSSEPRILIHGGSQARYLPTGQIVYARDGALLSVGFNLSKLEVTGTPVVVTNGLEKNWSGSDYSVSDTGTLVYPPDLGQQNLVAFTSVDLKGNVKPLLTPKYNTSEFSISPNGRFIAARLFGVANDDIWVYDIAVGTPQRVTSEPLDEIYPVWMPNGKRIVFGTRTGQIFWKSSDGAGEREELTRGDNPRYPLSVSPDGKRMVFAEIHPLRKRDIWLMNLDGDRKPQPLLTTDADEYGARFSPDGRWLAYVSNETGRDEVFIRGMSEGGGRKQLTSEGGSRPVWSADSRSIYFLKGDQLAVVTLDSQGNPTSRDHALFTVPSYQGLRVDGPDYFDIMPDGQHFVFLMMQVSSTATHYNLVLNWFNELQQRLLTK